MFDLVEKISYKPMNYTIVLEPNEKRFSLKLILFIFLNRKATLMFFFVFGISGCKSQKQTRQAQSTI